MKLKKEKPVNSEDKFRKFFEQSSNSLYFSSRDGRFVDVNQAALRLFGYSRVELIGKDVLEVYADIGERRIFQQLVEQYVDVKDYEMKLRRKDGSEIDCLVTSSLWRNDNGNILGYQGIIRDITEHKKATEALEQSHRIFALLAEFNDIITSSLEDNSISRATLNFLRDKLGVERSSITLWEPDQSEFRILDALPRNMAGLEKGTNIPAQATILPEIINKSRPRYRPDIADENSGTDIDLKLLRTGVKSAFHAPLRIKQKCLGTLNVGSLNIGGFSEDDRKLIALIASPLAQSLENADLYNSLLQSKERLAEAQHLANMGNWDWDIVKNKLYCSEEVYRIFGVAKKEFGATYETFFGYAHPDDIKFVKKSIENSLFMGKPYNIAYRILLPNGSERIVSMKAKVKVDKTGKPIRTIGTVYDITKRKREKKILRQKEERLVQVEKLAALGQLTSAVTHELNQPLNHINLICQYLEKKLPKTPLGKNEIIGDIQNIKSNIRRASKIIFTMKDYSRKETGRISAIDVHQAVKNAIMMFGTQLENHNISLSYKTRDNPLLALGSLNRLEQVIINMITNARDALNERNGNYQKSISIEVAEVEENVIIDVKDNGVGIPRSNLSNIFNPFFTTKPPIKGTGLGLSISLDIIKSFGGKLEINSKEGFGATVKITMMKQKHD